MAESREPIREVAESFADIIQEVDEDIGENRNYGAGIGPHDEDDQIDALVNQVRAQELFDGSIHTAKSNPREVRYPGGQSADLLILTDDTTVFCEAKLLRFQKANNDPSPEGYSKVFSPYQNRNPRSFLCDVTKLAESEIRATKAFLGIHYRPVNGAGTNITSKGIAKKFADDVSRWTDHSISVDTVARFSGLQHDVHQRGAVITWLLDEQPKQYF